LKTNARALLRAGAFFAPKGEVRMFVEEYCNTSEIQEVVQKFESCQYTPQEFSHARHLTVAAWYVAALSSEDALARMRVQLQAFAAHHRAMGYHETITRFWLGLVKRHLLSCDASVSLVDQVNTLIRLYPDKGILFRYYSRECVFSEDARSRWVPPDLCDLGH
jgi:hypothetical protein